MTGLPTLTVELEDGSGNFTNDVTAYVRLDKGWSLSRGWSDENDEDSIQPAVLRLRLDNTDGKFTLGASNFNGITKHKRMRLTETVGATVYRRCVVYVNDWPTEWDSAMGNMAFAAVTASDRFMRLNRRKLRSLTEQEIAADTPYAYYTLGEPTGSTFAGDTSGNGRAPLAPVTYSTTTNPTTFGVTGLNTQDGLTAASSAALTNYFLASSQPVLVTTSTALTVEIAETTDGFSRNLLILSNSSQAQSFPGSVLSLAMISGQVSVLDTVGAVATSPLTYSDGAVHVFGATVSGTTYTLYVDGAAVASGVGATIPAASTLYVGAIGSNSSGSNAVTFGHFSTYTTALSAARMLAHSDAIRNGSSADRADQRIARLASYANIATADQNLETGLQSAMAAQATSGQSVLDAMQDVAQSEGGGVFIAGDGKLTLHNKSHRVVKATGTPAITITADQIDPDMTWASDNYLFNTATGTRLGGATQRVVNSTSVGKYEEWPTTRDNALLSTDELVLNELQWVTTMYGEPLARLSSVTFDLLTLPQATVQSLLALELGDLVRITSWPSQSPAASVDLIVEGSKEEQTEKSWKITYNTAPSALFKAWILGDSTYGVLGSTTRLYF